MKKAIKAYLVEQQGNMETAIESRSAQKLFYDVMTPALEDLMREFVAYPEMMRTVTEEDQVDEITDYFIGYFLEQYASGYIEQYRATRTEIEG